MMRASSARDEKGTVLPVSTFTTSDGKMTVFVQKAMPGLVGTQFVAGSTGDITGYASVNSNAAQVCPQRPEDVAAFMGEPSTDPAITKLDPTSLSFAATDNAKTVTVTAANADDCTIEAATDKSEQFTTSVNGMVVTVTPKENTTEQAITATLTIKLMKAGEQIMVCQSRGQDQGFFYRRGGHG